MSSTLCTPFAIRMTGVNWQHYYAKRRMAVGREQLAMESSEPGRQLGIRACRAEGASLGETGL